MLFPGRGNHLGLYDTKLNNSNNRQSVHVPGHEYHLLSETPVRSITSRAGSLRFRAHKQTPALQGDQAAEASRCYGHSIRSRRFQLRWPRPGTQGERCCLCLQWTPHLTSDLNIPGFKPPHLPNRAPHSNNHFSTASAFRQSCCLLMLTTLTR